MAFDRKIFDDARERVSIETVLTSAHVKLVRRGTQDVGPCPLCCPGEKKGDSFKVRDDGWFCHRCKKGGDVVALEAALTGVSMIEAARALIAAPVTEKPVARREPAEPVDPRDTPTARIARELWRAGVPIAGTLAEVYLRARGIVPAVIKAVGSNLRYHPRAKWKWDRVWKSWSYAPAILILVVVADPNGAPVSTGGIHATYMTADGMAKAADDGSAKIMWGPQSLDGKTGGTWLVGPHVAALDGVSGAVGAEGAETALSLASLAWLKTGVVPRTFAALSLDRLQGRLQVDRQGCVDLKRLTPKPSSAAFTWPGIDDVEIGVDRDMANLEIRARAGPRNRPCDVILDGEARARICARMAVSAWNTAGSRKAWAIAPPPGSDFNDELRRVLAQRGDA